MATPTTIVVDADAFTRDYYSTITDLAALGGASETIELIPGRADTIARMWKMPMAPLRMGLVETFYQAMTANPTDDAAFRKAVHAAGDEWRKIHPAIHAQLGENISVGTDGMVLEMDLSMAALLGEPDSA
jgi:hypothetical protein